MGRRAGGVLLAAALLAACTPAAPPGLDLLRHFDSAEVLSDSLALEFLAARAFPERTGWRVAFRQPRVLVSRRQTPRLLLPVATTGEKELFLRARARQGRDFELALSMGGRPLGRLALGAAPAQVRLRVPASVQTIGESVLFFAPAADDASFELLELTLGPPGVGAAPSPEIRDAELRLAASSAAVFPLESAQGIAVLDLRPSSSNAARLRVVAETDAGRVTLVEREVAGKTHLELPLPGQPGFAALSVECLGPGGLRVSTLGLRAPAPTVHARVPAAAVQPALRPSFFVFLADTLRADALGAYGQQAPVSPRFDAFAREAVVFDAAWAQAPWTRSAVASLFTGLVEGRHGVTGWKSDLDPGFTTLAEALGAAGYRTASFCANPLVQEGRGFGQGFAHWRPAAANMGGAPTAETLVKDALRWLDAAGSEPVFIYMHALEPHTPYRAHARHWREIGAGAAPPANVLDAIPMLPSPSAAQRALVTSAYHAEARQSDAAFGLLLDGLQKRGRLASGAVVFLADHGEELWERGGHGHVRTLYEEMIRIPLAVRPPGGVAGGRRSGVPVGQVDVVPTLLALAGLKAPEGIDGRDLGPLVRGEAQPPAERRADTRVSPQSKRALRWGDDKLIVNDDDERLWRAGSRVELYDLRADPGERVNLASLRRATARFLEMRLRLGESRARREPEQERALSQGELEELRALGYVQ